MQITKYKYVFGEGDGRVYTQKFPQEIIRIKIQESHECNYSASLIFISFWLNTQMAPVSTNSCWQIIGIMVAVHYEMNRDAFIRESALPNAPFLSLMRLSSVPLQRDSGLNSMLPSFSTAATSSSTDCTSSSMKPTICMAFWEGKNNMRGKATLLRRDKTEHPLSYSGSVTVHCENSAVMMMNLTCPACTKWLCLCTPQWFRKKEWTKQSNRAISTRVSKKITKIFPQITLGNI